MLRKLILIACAGGLGSLARYAIAGWVQSLSTKPFPWGTVVVNLVGCLVFGLLWSLFESRVNVSGETRAIVLTGFIGAFTTFSTFMFETAQLMRDSQYLLAAGNVLLHNGVGICAIFAGLALGRIL